MTNKPAQVTEAHRELVLKIRRSAFDGSFAIRQSRCDELIADSEARALDAALEQWAKATPSVVHFKAITAERDQLRAQVALDEKAKAAMLKEPLHAVDELARLRAEIVSLSLEVKEQCAHKLDSMGRAEKAEAELAKERARLDFMNTRGFEHRHHETGDWLAYEWTITSAAEHKDVNLRDTIDAAMKEESK